MSLKSTRSTNACTENTRDNGQTHSERKFCACCLPSRGSHQLVDVTRKASFCGEEKNGENGEEDKGYCQSERDNQSVKQPTSNGEDNGGCCCCCCREERRKYSTEVRCCPKQAKLINNAQSEHHYCPNRRFSCLRASRQVPALR